MSMKTIEDIVKQDLVDDQFRPFHQKGTPYYKYQSKEVTKNKEAKIYGDMGVIIERHKITGPTLLYLFGERNKKCHLHRQEGGRVMPKTLKLKK